jgi:hypothetical protein
MCDVPSIAVFCSESIECFPGNPSKFFFKLLVTIPVAPVITGIILHFRFHIRFIYIIIIIIIIIIIKLDCLLEWLCLLALGSSFIGTVQKNYTMLYSKKCNLHIQVQIRQSEKWILVRLELDNQESKAKG